ncbi:MAG: ABC transporter ATP-binding protein [Fimbriimonadia bacterium]|nr:ABC transporter ATP-binding protein [Fimbriimonadia bacterium]
MSKLSIQGISKRFDGTRGEVWALKDVSLEIHKGEFLVIVGPSGCGKSTLLNIVAGLEKPTEGTVLADNKKVKKPGPDRSVVFQDGALFPWLSVQKNVEFGLRRIGLAPKERTERAAHYLGMVQLTQFKDNYIHELSGGMRQRVAIARALAVEPQVLLMDEPFSALDAMTWESLCEDLQQIWQRINTTIMFVTHNVREAICLGDRVIVLSARPGRIHAEFNIEIPRPRHIDDGDVARLAQQISRAIKGEHGHHPEELLYG